ncbi:IucA/IucC family protein [Paenibacillus rigui]|uniref:Short-chain oxidoreductase n=1 Tax=Paenibacillus rigui TaxID=554312 RepID=A0A229ULC7_9BACL|nr:IucA/IucC family protein [Paenibacillus rigui]OXM84181.1 short-chain oxidoreductase [Paenibacillus rigui]
MLHQHDVPLQAADSFCTGLAERSALRGLLNSFMRETGLQDPRVGDHPSSFLKDTATAAIRTDLWQKRTAGRGEPFVLPLTQSQAWIVGTITYYSMTGQHEYGDIFYTSVAGARDEVYPAADAGQLIDALLLELSCREPEPARMQKASEIREQIGNSIRRTVMYLERAMERAEASASNGFDYIRSEQSLLYGHPFHPTPKSSEGFSDEDLTAYAPELQAAFPLHYLAVFSELVCEEWIGEELPPTAEAAEAARRKLGERAADYKLLPLHPWQADYLGQISAVRGLMDDGRLVPLGAVGRKVYPTSSVRTVWEPEAGIFYKLPLHVRITNFIRENTPEQLRRTMDAAAVLTMAQRDVQIPGGEDGRGDGAGGTAGLRILKETGYRSVGLHSDEADATAREAVFSALAVVYRHAGELNEEEQSRCFVVASLMELPPGHKEPLLFQAVRQSAGGKLPDWHLWLAAYLKLSLLPLLSLFADMGISMEAHVQNSLLSLSDGMPVRYYVRDLEGISVSREQAILYGWTPDVVPEDSPVLYARDEAWLRLQYYFIVNHLGALIHTVARFDQKNEAVYWQTVRQVLLEERSRLESSGGLAGCIGDLLNKRSLPAKANLISRFQGRGETPDFVDISNPIYYCGGELKS